MLAILHTCFPGLEKDSEMWKKIYDFMDGERAYVTNAQAATDKYLFLGLKNELKNKELYWLIEQDDVIGCGYTREEFCDLWEEGLYEGLDGCIYLEPENVEILVGVN